MNDPRIERYATHLLDTCLGVQPGWQVLVWGTPWARPLLEEVTRQIGRRGAYALLRLKDLRPGGRIELDGSVVQENGTWLA